MDVITNIRVIVVDDSPNKAEERLNILRNEGFVVRPSLITSAASLHEALSASQWDLCLTTDDKQVLLPEEILDAFTEADSDAPLIVLCQDIATANVKVYLQAGISSVVDAKDKEAIVLAVRRDLAQLMQKRTIRQLKGRLRDSEKLCRHLLESSREAIGYTDGATLTYANPALCHLFAHNSFATLKGVPIVELVSKSQIHGFEHFLKRFHQDTEAEALFQSTGKRNDGSEFQADFTLNHAWFLGEETFQLKVQLQLEDAKEDQELHSMGQRDLLTGLYNRQFFIAALDDLLSANGDSISTHFLLYIELEDFDKLKSQLGLSGSDLLLSDAAKCIQASSKREQNITGRYNDDSFVVLMPDSSELGAKSHAEKLVKAIAAHVSVIGNESFNIKCYVGITMLNVNAPSSEEVIARAYQACQEGKQSQQHLVIYHHKQGPNQDEINKTIITQIQGALDTGNFQLKYQPMVNLHGETKEFYEVLVRMFDSDGNFLRPDKFLAVANNAGLLSKIDRWIIMHAIELLSEHRLQGHNSYLFIMLAGSSLCDKTLLPWISEALHSSRLPSDALIFEMNETDVAANVEEAVAFTNGLKELHCRTAITRFGSGLNSFNVLKQLAVDFVKLDPMFTQALYNDIPGAREDMQTLVKSIHAQGKLAIVPLVEDAKMMSILWQLGANYIQGYFISPPLLAMEYNFEGHLEELE